MSNSKTTAIPLVLPSLQALALAQFVKRVDFETVARFSAVTVVSDDGKSEADLIWLALIALRGALAETNARPVKLPHGPAKPEPGANQPPPRPYLVARKS